MDFRLVNKIIGFLQAVTIIWITFPYISRLLTDPGQFAMYLPLPVIPISFCALFGILSLFDLKDHFRMYRMIYIFIHILVNTSGIILFFVAPVFPTVLLGLPISLILIGIMDENNYYKTLFLTLCISFFPLMASVVLHLT